MIHKTDHDPEDTLLVAVDTKELLLLIAGLTLLWNLQPCLAFDVDDLAYRLDELMKTQWGEMTDEDS